MLGEERLIITKDLQQNIRPWMYFLYQPCEKLAIKCVLYLCRCMRGSKGGESERGEKSSVWGNSERK